MPDGEFEVSDDVLRDLLDVQSPSNKAILQAMVHPQIVRILMCALVHPERSKWLKYSRHRLAHLLAFSSVAYDLCLPHQETSTAPSATAVPNPIDRMNTVKRSVLHTAELCAEMANMVCTTESSTSVFKYMKVCNRYVNRPLLFLLPFLWKR